jgi:hypothetical protein
MNLTKNSIKDLNPLNIQNIQTLIIKLNNNKLKSVSGFCKNF